MANYSFNLHNHFKSGTENIQKEIRKITNPKKKQRKLESILIPEQVDIRLRIGIDSTHRFYCNTGFQVLPKHWDFEKQRMKWQASGSQNFNQRLNN
ncbi:MAG: hypothetical protein ACOCVA_08010, partial [Prolixibacteraceae bacterium]